MRWWNRAGRLVKWALLTIGLPLAYAVAAYQALAPPKPIMRVRAEPTSITVTEADP